jgi:D-amino-acid dehydrogenase
VASSPVLTGQRSPASESARPVTADGLPLIGATRQPGIFAADGHGMWGMTLGPATGRLLAEVVASGKTPKQLSSFDPCR